MVKSKKKILMVTGEAVPFAKTGGLADAVSALSIALKEAGNDVRIIMPRYYMINTKELKKHKAPLGVPLGDREAWGGIFEGKIPHSEVPVYFLDNNEYYGREGVYGPNPGSSFPDNSGRFHFLCKAVFQLCRNLNWIPDILHCHDWMSGPVPLYLQTEEIWREFGKTASVMTIHNLGYQGNFPVDDIHHFTLDAMDVARRNGYHNGDLNFLKMGIENAEIVTTVSPTYATEIQTPEYGFGLDETLRYRKNDLFGILNGVDYTQWHPENDQLIPVKYSVKDRSGKKKAKEELQKYFGLEIDPDIPIVGIVSRMAEQKGFGALCGPGHGSLFRICTELNLQFIVVGSGDQWCEDELNRLNSRLPNMGLWIGYNNQLAHLVEAGSDFFLMPSVYEPCGLNQLYSLKYGTLPIVRHTGGLADTVENFNEETGEGTGFLFNDLTPGAIFDTVGWAVYTWHNHPEKIDAMITRAMRKDFSWESSVEEYLNIYQWALDRRQGRFAV